MTIYLTDATEAFKTSQEQRKDEFTGFITSMQSEKKKVSTHLSNSQKLFKTEQKKRKETFKALTDDLNALFLDQEKQRIV